MNKSTLLGRSGLYLFSLTAVWGIAGANIGLALMLIAMLIQGKEVWARLKSVPVVWLILAAGVYVVLSAVIASSALPETLPHQLEQARKWGHLVLVLLVAWWLREDPRQFYVAFILFTLGVLVRIFTHLPMGHISELLSGQYYSWGFGLYHISFSSYLAVIILGVLLFAHRSFAVVRGQGGHFALALVLLLVLAICVEGILVSKSRGTWIALAVVLPVTLLAYLNSLRKSLGDRFPFKKIVAGLAVVGVLFVGTIAASLDGLTKRAMSERQTFAAMLKGDVSKVPMSSVGIRIHLYDYGVRKWLERPLFGWGTGSEDYLMEQSGIFNSAGYALPHFHNIFIELLVRFGLVGFCLLFAILWLAYRNLWRLYRAGQVPRDWYYFLMAMLAFSLTWSLWDIRIVRWDYRDFVLLFFGMVVAMMPGFAGSRFFERLRPPSGG